jgi:DNA-binding MarR family transcriptional regulator
VSGDRHSSTLATKPAKAPSPRASVGKDERIALTLLRVLNKVQADRRVTLNYGSGRPITMIEAEVCALINASRRLTGSELANALGVTHSAISQVTTKLISKGHVRVQRDQSNGRIKWLSLTPAGQRAAREIRDHYQDMTASVLGSSTRDRAVILRFLENLEGFLDQARNARE